MIYNNKNTIRFISIIMKICAVIRHRCAMVIVQTNNCMVVTMQIHVHIVATVGTGFAGFCVYILSPY